jgi:hypothetical protein
MDKTKHLPGKKESIEKEDLTKDLKELFDILKGSPHNSYSKSVT